MDGENVRITRYRPEDEAGILNLFHQVFKRKRDENFWRWENIDNPHGRSVITLLKDGGEVVGHLGLQLSRLWVEGESVKAGQRIASMLHPRYRGRGYYQRMLKHLVGQAERAGVSLTYSFPNEPALRALKKVPGNTVVGMVPRHVKIYRGFAASHELLGNRLLAGAAGAALQLWRQLSGYPSRTGGAGKTGVARAADGRFSRLWQRLREEFRVAVERSAGYIKWRYFDSPRDYRVVVRPRGNEIAGFAALLVEKERGYVVDLLAEDGDAALGLLAHADEYFLQSGCHSAFLWRGKDDCIQDALRGRGFVKFGAPNALVVADVAMPERVSRVVTGLENWHLTIGDSDYH